MEEYGINEYDTPPQLLHAFQGSEKLESPPLPTHTETHSYPSAPTEADDDDGNGEIEGRDSHHLSPKIPPSPLPHSSISPQGPLHSHANPSSQPCTTKLSPSPQTTLLSKDHLSPHPTRTSPPRRNDSPRKRLSTSPKVRRPQRSLSRSPNRHRGSSYGSRREYRDRSPIARDRYRRSPRRYSPRRRSPPGYHSRHRSPRRRPWSPPHSRNNGVGRPGNNLFVAGFSFVTTERDLERKFSRFGRVRDVRIVRDKRSGDSRGFGFLSLERDEDADAAIRALDQTEWNGRVVLVEKSKSR